MNESDPDLDPMAAHLVDELAKKGVACPTKIALACLMTSADIASWLEELKNAQDKINGLNSLSDRALIHAVRGTFYYPRSQTP